MRILTADDSRSSRFFLSTVLKNNGYDIIEAEDGQEALEEMSRPGAPNMAILDWMMPKMDGLTVLRKIRARPSENPPYIILLTGKGERSDIVTGLDAGANDYLGKPFDEDELMARISVGIRMLEIQNRLVAKVQELSLALEHIKILQGIIPICSFCKKIRNDQGYWEQVENYISDHSQALFSHSFCPECMKKHYPDIWEENEKIPMNDLL